MKRSEILDAAKKCVCEDRNKQYGNPEDNFGKIAELWSAYRGELFLKRDVAMMMSLVKIARIYAGESVDSYIDLAGYAACGGELAEEEKKEPTARKTEPAKRKTEEIFKLSSEVGKSLLSDDIDRAMIPRRKYIFTTRPCFRNPIWIGIDNSTGDFWVEEFDTEKQCRSWLNREFEVGEEDSE